MVSKPEKIIISKDGVARGIHGPLVDAVTRKLGEVAIMRASHVEPGSGLSDAALACLPGTYMDLDRVHGRFDMKIHPDYASKWFADMTPVREGIVLGPYDDRDTALREEVEWLKANNVPVCGPCREANNA